MLDLLATVPYYTAYLSRALLQTGANLDVASITYYLDPACFSGRGITLSPGCLNVVGRFPLARGPRRVLKLVEMAANLLALTLRSAIRAPEILHIQYLPLLRWPLPLDLWFVRWVQRRGTKLVLTVHDLMPHDTADEHKAAFERLYRRMDALICHSEHIKARLTSEFGIAEERIAVIPHGPFFYDLPATTEQQSSATFGVPSGHSTVLWQGIIFPYKGLDLLLEAWQAVEQANSAAHLVVVGTGDPVLLANLRQQVHRLGLQRLTLDLRFVSTEELVAAYRAAEIVVYPYRAITTSGALATGLALGKAIVASDLPVFREILTSGENALLVSPGDKVQLAAAILKLLDDAQLRRQFAAKVAAMNFGAESWRAIADDTLAVYRSVLQHGEKNNA